MDRLGLDAHDLRLYHAGILDTHLRRVEAHLLELDSGKHITDLSDRVLDGDVQYDVHADVSRTLDLRLVDDQRANLGFDPTDPSAAPVHRSRMLRVIDSRWIDTLGGWVDCHVFTGPVFDFERDGAEISVTAHSLERQALGDLFDVYEAKAHKKKLTDVIRELLALVGDVNAAVPDLDHTLPHDLTLHSTDQVWPHVRRLAAAVDHYVFYNGSGRFVMRRFNQRPAYHFHRGLMSHVKPRRGSLEHNTWVVLGPNPKGPRPRPRGVAVLRGPSSPAGLSRHGVPHHLVRKEERAHAKTDRQCQVIADRLALEGGTVRTDLAFDHLPVPNLEEHDAAGVSDDAIGTARIRMLQWNLPLAGGDTGGSPGPVTTIGTNRRTVKARIRRP